MTSVRHRRIATAVALVIAAAVASAVTIHVLGDNEYGDNGPLQVAAEDRVGRSVRVGEPFVFGITVLYNHANKDAVLESVKLADPPAGFEVVKTFVAGPRRKYLYVATSHRWPEPSLTDLRRVRGARIAPLARRDGERGAELVFVIRATRPGHHQTRKIRLRYRVGDDRYSTTVSAGMTACAAASGERLAEDCPIT